MSCIGNQYTVARVLLSTCYAQRHAFKLAQTLRYRNRKNTYKLQYLKLDAGTVTKKIPNSEKFVSLYDTCTVCTL